MKAEWKQRSPVCCYVRKISHSAVVPVSIIFPGQDIINKSSRALYRLHLYSLKNSAFYITLQILVSEAAQMILLISHDLKRDTCLFKFAQQCFKKFP